MVRINEIVEIHPPRAKSLMQVNKDCKAGFHPCAIKAILYLSKISKMCESNDPDVLSMIKMDAEVCIGMIRSRPKDWEATKEEMEIVDYLINLAAKNG